MLKSRLLLQNSKKLIQGIISSQTLVMSDIKSCNPSSEKGTFIQSLNPMTGQREWKMVPNDYDYQQEVARAAFADMLHDTERVKFILYFCQMSPFLIQC
jgi:hypothetical protein